MDLRRIGAGIACAIVMAAGAGLRADETAEGDLKKLKGHWVAAGEEGHKVTYDFDGATLKVVAPTRSYTITVKLDPAAKPDKTIDLKIDEAPDDAKGKTSLGIYKFDGDDTFIFCFAPLGDRPAEYKQEGYEKIVTKLKRSKE